MEDEQSRRLSETEFYTLLSQQRRRLALRILQDESASITAIELARYVAEYEYEDPSDETLRDVHTSLYHSHLPKLEDADVITYDQDDGTIRRGRNFAALVERLESEAERTGSRLGP
jgi:predicted transcriptional regulator